MDLMRWKMKSSKELTAPQPHKVIKEMSLFLGKFEAQPNNEGWVFKKNLPNEDGYIRVASRKKVNAHDGKIFDFVMSSLFAQHYYEFKGKLKDFRSIDTDKAYSDITIDMSEVNAFRGIKNSKQNRNTIFESLENMVGMTVEMKQGKKYLIYSVLTSIKVDEVNPNILYVKVNEEINEAFHKAGLRPINVERALSLRSDIAVEFTKFLQVRGRGIIRNEPIPPDMFEHDDVVYFLHLEHLNEVQQLKAIRRATIAVGAQGFATYKMKRFSNKIKWLKDY